MTLLTERSITDSSLKAATLGATYSGWPSSGMVAGITSTPSKLFCRTSFLSRSRVAAESVPRS